MLKGTFFGEYGLWGVDDNTCRRYIHDKTCTAKRADVETRRGTSLPRGGFYAVGLHTVGLHAVGSRGGLHAVGLYSHIYIMRMCPHDKTCRRYTNDKTCPTKRADVETCRGTSLPRGDLHAVGCTQWGLYAVGLYSHIYIMRMCPHDNTCR